MNKVTINPQIQLTYQIEGKGDPIILLHGLDGNLAGFEDLQHQLASSYKVLTYDLRIFIYYRYVSHNFALNKFY
ncbi:hypothetical protein XD18_05720 [Staphylococcus aureus]|nr:hypothetical protein [Staphylococcus aureus]